MADFGASALTHMLVVRDTAVSRDWYVSVLGARLVDEYVGSSVVPELLDNWLLLVPGGGPDAGEPTVELAPPADSHVVGSQSIFRVDDCETAYRELSARGAEFLAPPHARPGETRAFFRDPDGHLFEISSFT